MGSAHRKGRDFEVDVIPWLQVLFPRIQRTGIGFNGSDYRETGPFAIEAKNHAKLALAEWMTQTLLNTKQEKRKYPVLIHKKRRYGPESAYVTMPLENWVEMICDLKGIRMPEGLAPVSDDIGIPEWDDLPPVQGPDDDLPE